MTAGRGGATSMPQQHWQPPSWSAVHLARLTLTDRLIRALSSLGLSKAARAAGCQRNLQETAFDSDDVEILFRRLMALELEDQAKRQEAGHHTRPVVQIPADRRPAFVASGSGRAR